MDEPLADDLPPIPFDAVHAAYDEAVEAAHCAIDRLHAASLNLMRATRQRSLDEIDVDGLVDELALLDILSEGPSDTTASFFSWHRPAGDGTNDLPLLRPVIRRRPTASERPSTGRTKGA